MVRKTLSIQEIKDLSKLTAKVFKYYTSLKKKDKIANYIQYPKTPNILSESLAIQLILKNKILTELSSYEISLGGNIADVVAKKSNSIKKIEVKATGAKEFQEFGPKDIIADYLIWINFGDSFLKDDFSKISIFILKNPKKYFKNPTKIVLSKFRLILGKKIVQHEFNLSTL